MSLKERTTAPTPLLRFHPKYDYESWIVLLVLLKTVIPIMNGSKLGFYKRSHTGFS